MLRSRGGQPLKVVVADIEGTLTPGKGKPVDFDALSQIRDHNRQARREGRRPPLTLCTGRPQPFVEAFSQLLEVWLPSICENGALIYDPTADSAALLDTLTPEQVAVMGKVRRRAHFLAKELDMAFEPGKELCVSLAPRASQPDWPLLMDRVRQALEEHAGAIELTHSNSAVDIMPRGVDKAAGLLALVKRLGVSPGEVLGIGDSQGDLRFLERVGLSAAPSNASEEVKRRVDLVATQRDAGGVAEILHKLDAPTA